MNIFRIIASIFKREKTVNVVSGAPRTGGIIPWYTGCANTLSVSTAYSCIKLLCDSVASLPVLNLKKRGGIFVEVDDELTYLLNVEPDYNLNAYDFWRQVELNIITDGNAYIVPVYNIITGKLDRLALCHRGTVAHDTLNDTYEVNDSITGITGTFAEDEIIHIKGLTSASNSKVGISVLTYARLTLDIANAGDLETCNRFVNGGNVRGMVTNDKSVRGFGEYQDEQLTKMAEDIDNKFQGGTRIVSLPGQVDFKQISLSSTDMQFLESRKFTVVEICRFFGVHPSFVFADTANNYKSVEQASVDFLNKTLNPLLRNIEIELRRKLFSRDTAATRKIQFDRRALYACDIESQMKYREKLLQTGTTVNELRRLDNRGPVEGGDDVLVSANLKTIKELSANE